MMNELQFALDNNVSMDVEKLNHNEVLVKWNNDQNVMILSVNEAVEMGLIDVDAPSLQTFEAKLIELFGAVKTKNKQVISLLKNPIVEARYDGHRYYFKVEGYNMLKEYGIITCTNRNKSIVISKTWNWSLYSPLI